MGFVAGIAGHAFCAFYLSPTRRRSHQFLVDADEIGLYPDVEVLGVGCVVLENVAAYGWYIGGYGVADAYVLTPERVLYDVLQHPDFPVRSLVASAPIPPELALGRAADGDPAVVERIRALLAGAFDETQERFAALASDAVTVDMLVEAGVRRFLDDVERLGIPATQQSFSCRFDPDDEILVDHYREDAARAAAVIREPMPHVTTTGWRITGGMAGEDIPEDYSFVITPDGNVFPHVQPSTIKLTEPARMLWASVDDVDNAQVRADALRFLLALDDSRPHLSARSCSDHRRPRPLWGSYPLP